MAGVGSLGPLGTLVTVGPGPTSTPVIGQNSNRNGIIFFNSSSTTTVFLVPANLGENAQFIAGAGIPLLPQFNTGATLMPQILPIGYGGGWVGVTSGGSAVVLV